jgi:hypothetical protein
MQAPAIPQIQNVPAATSNKYASIRLPRELTNNT